jgi:adenylate cyclase
VSEPSGRTGLLGRIAAIGRLPSDDDETRVRKGALAIASVSVTVLASLWVALYLALDRPLAAAMPLAYQAGALVSLADLARNRRIERPAALQVLLILLLPVLLGWTLGGFVNSGMVMIWAFLGPMGALVFAGRRLAVRAFLAFVALTLLSGALDGTLAAGATPLPEAIRRAFFVLDVLGVALVTFLVILYFVRDRERALHELARAYGDLRAAQATSEGLLRNILPDAVAERLKGGSRRVADGYAAVTVLFIDIADFTPLASRLPADGVVDLLDRVFSALDGLAERHGLEKIKTVGDLYMAVAGLPEPRPALEGARAAAEMALEALPAVGAAAGPDLPLRVRVGMHTGPVVAGVIGQRKFAYDLWGDAVNVASRMESHGLPGRIQASLATFELLQQEYEFRFRGTLDVKGRGEMATYLLLGRRERGSGPDA